MTVIAAVLLTPLAFRDVVLAAVAACVSASTPVNWEGGAREFGDLRLLLDVVSQSELSDRDDLFDADEDSQVVSSVLDTVIQCKAESTFDSGDADAVALLGQVRYGLRRLSVRTALAAAGVDLVATPGPSRNVSFGSRANGRRVCSHVLEFTVRAAFGLATGETTGLIEHVELSGTVEDPGAPDVDVGPLTIDDPTPTP